VRKFSVTALKVSLLLIALTLFISCSRKNIPANEIVVETGVSQSLANFRKQVLQHIGYNIILSIPERKPDSIAAFETISFSWKKNSRPLQIDFKEEREHLQRVIVNGHSIPVVFEKEHILIAPQHLKNGHNKIAIQFIAGNLSLNRSEEYLYTLLVPDRARTVFPCFDQPDLKAGYQLALEVPHTWDAVSNAPLKDIIIANRRKTFRFEPSDTISTYLFSFVAGRFKNVQRTIGARVMNFYHRETDSSKIRLSLDPVFNIHRDALAFMEDYTAIPYPFKKFDFVAIPDFQYGGMEHVGAIQYKASSLFLDEGATKDQELDRASLLAHETAHMWFGDLVTMRWFDDVWMKEVFANFMADKITDSALANASYDLKFLLDHFPAAYRIDRTEGANPIRQPLQNLKDAGTLYGNIIYHKAPVVMRQLELLMGKEALRDGLRAYLHQYAYGNASWPDLIRILDARTPVDLQAWNQIWVEETGRPKIDFHLLKQDNKIDQLVLSQKGEDGSSRIWPQLFEMALIYPDRVEEITVNMNGREVVITEAKGKDAPLFMLFNSSGKGYGLFPLEEPLLPPVNRQVNAVMRASAYINLYENMLTGRYCKPMRLIELYRARLQEEPEELNLRLMTSQLSNTFWRFLLPTERKHVATILEKELWNALQKETVANKKKILFHTIQNIALNRGTLDSLYSVWKEQKPPSGVKLTEDDYTALALALAVRDYPDSSILMEQLKRIKNADRQKRLTFMLPALSPDEKERDEFFYSLRKEEAREKESWVIAALQYLHHPLRTTSSQKYLRESLDMLEEIQRTGDIFFPQSWLQSTFGAYQTPEAAGVVRSFLQEHPGYHLKLKEKIMQAEDGLFRAEKLLYGNK
jgi:aminopeptidase N